MTDEEFKAKLLRLLREISAKLDAIQNGIYSTGWQSLFCPVLV